MMTVGYYSHYYSSIRLSLTWDAQHNIIYSIYSSLKSIHCIIIHVFTNEKILKLFSLKKYVNIVLIYVPALVLK